MSTLLADKDQNPYASPRLESGPAPSPPTPVAKPGSLVIILVGFMLVLGGYLTSNLFLISDLYQVGFGPDGKVLSSPFAAAFSTPGQQWMLYAACAAAFIAGAIMVGSQPFNPMAVVCYAMCPLICFIFIVAWPLRVVQKYADAVAAFDLLVGSSLLFTGATRMFLLYGQRGGGFEPVAASMMTEAGLALMLGSALKFYMSSSRASSADATAAA
jgi:hypothetical protein